MRLLIQVPKNKGVAYHRLLSPHIVMKRLFPDFSFETTQGVYALSEKQIKGFDAVLIHSNATIQKAMGQMLVDDYDATIDKLKRCDVPLILDQDDYWHATPDMFFYDQWKLEQRHKAIEHSIRKADAVTCVAAPLARKIQKHTGKSPFVLPNCIDATDPQFWPQPTKSKRLRFGFLGGASHEHDIKIVGEAVKELWYRYPELRDKWQVVFAGFSTEFMVKDHKGRVIESVDEGRPAQPGKMPSVRMEKSLTGGYRTVSPGCAKALQEYDQFPYACFDQPKHEHENYRRLWSRGIEQYATMYNHFDVALAPLRNNTFNSCKSELKIVEAAAFNKHIICSEVAPFSNVYEDLRLSENDGLNVLTDSEWLDCMLSYIEEFVSTEEIAPPAYAAKVNERYNAETWAKARYSIYKTVIG